MNLETLQQQKEAKLAELQALEQQIKEAEMRRPFLPCGGDAYYFLNSDGSIQNDNWYGAMGKNADCGRRMIGNCFRNMEDAERFNAFLTLLAELKEYADKVNEGWKADWTIAQSKCSFYYEHDLKRISITENMTVQYPIVPYFKSREAASSAIAHFGDRLKLLFEYYNS